MQTIKKHLSLLIVILIIFTLSLYLQLQTIKNADAIWLLQATQQLLQGKHYYTDFIETNPPMILYLYMPAQFMAKIFSMDVYTAFRLYLYGLIALSLFGCSMILKQIIPKTDTLTHGLFMVMLAFVLMTLSAYSFSEREQFAVIFTLPYFLWVALRLTHNTPTRSASFIVGLFAGLGFALKPYFLPPLILTELYFILKQKNLLSWMRIETLTIGGVFIVYLISIFIFTPEYLYKILPLVNHFYLNAQPFPASEMLGNMLFVFCAAAIIFYLFLWPQLHYRALATTLWLALIGYLIAYLIASRAWFYHLLPALSFATLLFTLFLSESFSTLLRTHRHQKKIYRKQIILIVCSVFFITFMPLLRTVVFQSFASLKRLSPNIQNAQRIVHFYNDGKPIYVFTDSLLTHAYFTSYAHAESASRFPALFFMAGVLHQSEKTQTKTIALQQEMIDFIVNDLQKNKPTLIVIDKNRTDSLSHYPDFSYIQFFSQDARFRTLWQHYQYRTTIGAFQVFTRRKNDA
ncbi:MAG: hypothetical protein AABY34_01185 [Pseudomonadota bacterium]